MAFLPKKIKIDMASPYILKNISFWGLKMQYKYQMKRRGISSH